jgi:hypothetical protein
MYVILTLLALQNNILLLYSWFHQYINVEAAAAAKTK